MSVPSYMLQQLVELPGPVYRGVAMHITHITLYHLHHHTTANPHRTDLQVTTAHSPVRLPPDDVTVRQPSRYDVRPHTPAAAAEELSIAGMTSPPGRGSGRTNRSAVKPAAAGRTYCIDWVEHANTEILLVRDVGNRKTSPLCRPEGY